MMRNSEIFKMVEERFLSSESEFAIEVVRPGDGIVSVFDMHFPGNPIVPAFMLVALAKDILEYAYKRHVVESCNDSDMFAEVKKSKFISPIVPGDVLVLRVVFGKLPKVTIFKSGVVAAIIEISLK